MSGERLPELLRGLGIEPFLDDARTSRWISPAERPIHAMLKGVAGSSNCSSGVRNAFHACNLTCFRTLQPPPPWFIDRDIHRRLTR